MDRKIIDLHNHLMNDESAIPEYEKVAEELGISKIVFQGLEWPGVDFSRNSAIKKAINARPDLFVGFGGVNLWKKIKADRIDKLRDDGFTGLKFIVPPEPYHSERFYPYYERAEKLKMPCLFHLGIVSARATQHVRVDNNFMRPIYLDTIARSFKDLTVIGAHLGNPWFEEATMSARWNPNLFFDITGSTLKKKKPEYIGELLWWSDTTEYKSPYWSSAWEQIVFGTDVPAHRMFDVVNDYENLMNTLNISEKLQNLVFYGTSANILRKAGVEI
ncbi:MAG: amidohydrolase family protein [Candidatus Latescibacteria bacterium]|nr:amidohydrolase family protein [Candidatus Latescibacterota bacterium]